MRRLSPSLSPRPSRFEVLRRRTSMAKRTLHHESCWLHQQSCWLHHRPNWLHHHPNWLHHHPSLLPLQCHPPPSASWLRQLYPRRHRAALGRVHGRRHALQGVSSRRLCVCNLRLKDVPLPGLYGSFYAHSSRRFIQVLVQARLSVVCVDIPPATIHRRKARGRVYFCV